MRAVEILDHYLVIDLSTNPTQGDSALGPGTANVQTVVKGLKAGKTYHLELRLSNADFATRESRVTSWGGIRLGGIRQINGDHAISEAVQLASCADGKCGFVHFHPLI